VSPLLLLRAVGLVLVLMATLPVYALTVFEEDDSTPLFTVSTNPLATYPYLKAFDNFPEQEIDFAKGAASIGQQLVDIVDVPQTPGDQVTGFLTGLLATAAGYSALNGRRALTTQDHGSGAEAVLDGVVKGVSLLDTFASFRLELRDIRERERKCRAFERTDTPTVLPRGVLNGYSKVVPATRPLKARYLAVSASVGVFVMLRPTQDLPELALTAAQRDALFSVAPVPAETYAFVYDRWKVLWRLTASGGAYTEVAQVAQIHASAGFFGTRLLLEDEVGVVEFWVNNVVSGDTLPSHEDLVDFIVQYDGPVTKDWPLHIQSRTAGDLLAELYDGDYSVEPPRIRYDAAAVAALATPVRARITEPADNLREWTEKHLFPIAHTAPTLNADGEIAPVTYLLPPAGASLPHLDDDNCAPDGAGWAHGTQDAVNLVRVTYKREYRVPPHHAPGLAESDRIREREVPVERRIQASIDLLGEQPLDVSSLLLSAIGTPDGGPLGGDVVDETGQQVAARVSYMATDRFALGGQYFRVRGMRTDAAVEALKVGDWVTCGFSWMPDYLLGTRGLSRLAQVVARRNLSAVSCSLTLIDAGSANAPVSAPTLGTLSSDAAGVVTIPVSAIGSGAEARIDYAILPEGETAEPATGSELWSFLTRVDATGDVTTTPVAAGRTVWVRARGEQVGRRPSAWTTADDITVAQTARVEDVVLTLSETGVPTVSWTPNAYCNGVEINYDRHAIDTAPGAGTDVDVDASDGSYEIPVRVGRGFDITVTVTPYTGWTGSAVSGSAGPAIELRARGTVLYQVPVVAMTVAQSGATGSMDLTIQDPDLVVTSIEFGKKEDAGGYAALATTWDRSTGTLGTDTGLERGEDIPLTSKHSVSIRYVVNYDRGNGAETLEGAHSFDSDLVAEITGCLISFGQDGEVIVAVQGDEDCTDIYVTVGDGSAPADPGVGTNDGTVAARSGTIDTGVTITPGNRAFVKVIGAWDDSGTKVLGPVQSYQSALRLGVLHVSSVERDHTGDTAYTVLESVPVPPLSVPFASAVRVRAVFTSTGTGGTKEVSIAYAGVLAGTAFTLPTGNQTLTIDVTFEPFASAVTGLIALPVQSAPRAASVSVDHDDPQDIDFGVEMVDAGDTVTLEFSEVTWLGEAA
jgi:hypothetical protein